MESNGRDAKIKPIIDDLVPQKETSEEVLDKEEDVDTERLLPPRNGGISKGPPKTKRKVQWNDINGNKLAEILEFEPSDVSDTDDDDADACFCTIM